MNCQEDGEEVASALLFSKPDVRHQNSSKKDVGGYNVSKHLVHTSITSEPSLETSDSTL